MQIERLSIAALTPEHLEQWSALQRANAQVQSPFFRPEFIQAVAAIRDDVEVAVLSDGSEVVGFWPFQRAAGNVGLPAGDVLSDYQGPILRPGLSIVPEQVLRAVGLRAWYFNHLPASMLDFVPHQQRVSESPYLDLSGGFEAYRKSAVPSSSDEISQAMRKARKLEREIGAVRFDLTDDHTVLERLLAWKQQQYQRTGVPNVLARRWVVPLLHRVLETQSPDFRPVLSALYAGQRLVAAHFGMAAGRTLHYWFPAYDVEFARFSPGTILLLKTAEACSRHGLDIIDLGKGQEPYKRRFMSGVNLVADGFIDLRPIPRAMHSTWWKARNWLHGSRLRQPARRAWDRLQPVRQWLQTT